MLHLDVLLHWPMSRSSPLPRLRVKARGEEDSGPGVFPLAVSETGALCTAARSVARMVLCFQKLCCPMVPLTGLFEVQSTFFLCSKVPSSHQPCLSQPQTLGKALHTVPLWVIQLAVRPSWGPIQSLCCSLEYCTMGYSMPVPLGVRPLWSSTRKESHIPGAGPGPIP